MKTCPVAAVCMILLSACATLPANVPNAIQSVSPGVVRNGQPVVADVAVKFDLWPPYIKRARMGVVCDGRTVYAELDPKTFSGIQGESRQKVRFERGKSVERRQGILIGKSDEMTDRFCLSETPAEVVVYVTLTEQVGDRVMSPNLYRIYYHHLGAVTRFEK